MQGVPITPTIGVDYSYAELVFACLVPS